MNQKWRNKNLYNRDSQKSTKKLEQAFKTYNKKKSEPFLIGEGSIKAF